MGSDLNCEKCGQPYETGQTICGTCGHAIGQSPGSPVVLPVPDFQFSLPKIPSFDQGLAQGAIQSLSETGKIDFSAIRPAIGAKPQAEGLPYRPLFAIGRSSGESIRQPYALASGEDGAFLVLNSLDDSGRPGLRIFDRAGKETGPSISIPSGIGPDALNAASALAVGPQGDIFIADMGADAIAEFSSGGRFLRLWGSSGTGPDQMDMPQGIAVGKGGEIHIADSGNSRILQWDSEGGSIRVLGINRLDEESGCMASGDQSGEFDEPKGLCLDGGGNLYVADTSNHRVQVFGPDGKLRLVFGEEGTDPGQLFYPRRIRANLQGEIFVADSKYGRIQKFNSEGQFLFQVVMPADVGLVDDFLVVEGGRFIVALRSADLVLGIELV